MSKDSGFQDQGYFRRKFPRRILKKKVGVLLQGHYLVCESGEIGEGGMALHSDMVFAEGQSMVVSFQIPMGDFVSLRAEVKSIRKGKNECVHGLNFSNITFSHKRQIRSFVSSRTAGEDILL